MEPVDPSRGSQQADERGECGPLAEDLWTLLVQAVPFMRGPDVGGLIVVAAAKKAPLALTETQRRLVIEGVLAEWDCHCDPKWNLGANPSSPNHLRLLAALDLSGKLGAIREGVLRETRTSLAANARGLFGESWARTNPLPLGASTVPTDPAPDAQSVYQLANEHAATVLRALEAWGRVRDQVTDPPS